LESDVASKPVDTRVAYVGFRCVQAVSSTLSPRPLPPQSGR